MALISLNEAITALMGEGGRKPEQEIGILFEAQNEMRRRLTECVAALRQLSEGKRWLALLLDADFEDHAGRRHRGAMVPSWPPESIIEALGEPQADWPSLLVELVDAAARSSRVLRDYESKYGEKAAFIFDGARLDRVRVSGSLSRAPQSRRHMLSAAHFVNNVTIDGDRYHMIASARRRGSFPGYQPIPPPATTSDAVPTYFNVEVESDDVERLCAYIASSQRHGGKSKKVSAPPPSDHLAAFEKGVFDKFADRDPPGREDLCGLLVERFGPYVKVRDDARAMRIRLWPDAAKPGPRPGKSKGRKSGG